MTSAPNTTMGKIAKRRPNLTKTRQRTVTSDKGPKEPFLPRELKGLGITTDHQIVQELDEGDQLPTGPRRSRRLQRRRQLNVKTDNCDKTRTNDVSDRSDPKKNLKRKMDTVQEYVVDKWKKVQVSIGVQFVGFVLMRTYY